MIRLFAWRRNSFARGVHPRGKKKLAADAPIEVLPTPAVVQIALLQHLGAPSEAAVEPKSTVALGDVIARANGFVSAAAHASVEGVVGRMASVTLPNGRHVHAIPIKPSETQPLTKRDLWSDLYGGDWPCTGIDRREPEEIVAAARESGLVGLGGAAFPTHVKLAPNPEKPIRSLLINGCECEPFLTADYRLMVEAPEPIIAGALLARRATGADRVTICVEDNKPAAIDALKQAAEGTPVRLRVLKTKYPQGGEKQLIFAALGKEVPLGGLPLDVGVVVLNVSTTAALARAVLRGKPLTHRVITISGSGVVEPKNVLAPIGASYRDLVDFCGGLTDDAVRVVAGGPMMGFTLGNLDTPVTKGTSGVSVLTRTDIEREAETTCLRCGRCAQVCPMYLVPAKLAQAARVGDLALAERYHINACMECGCCAYECPASIPLVQLIRLGKVKLRSK